MGLTVCTYIQMRNSTYLLLSCRFFFLIAEPGNESICSVVGKNVVLRSWGSWDPMWALGWIDASGFCSFSCRAGRGHYPRGCSWKARSTRRESVLFRWVSRRASLPRIPDSLKPGAQVGLVTEIMQGHSNIFTRFDGTKPCLQPQLTCIPRYFALAFSNNIWKVIQIHLMTNL